MDYSTLELIIDNSIATIKLNRPDKRNALNLLAIKELKSVVSEVGANSSTRILQIEGNGKAFCAGADIGWLSELRDSSREEIERSFNLLGELLLAILNLPQIVIVKAHGAVYGGGAGLLAVSDVAICSNDVKISFSEINIGLIPATISPFVVRKLGVKTAKLLFISGEVINAEQTLEYGLSDMVVETDKLDEFAQSYCQKLLEKPKLALVSMKKLLRGIEEGKVTVQNQDAAIFEVSRLIKTDETQKLFNKFLLH